VEVPAILDDETFQTAQAQLRNNQATASRNRRHDYLLAGGFLRCATCGRMMTGKVTSRGQRRYRCTSRTNVLDVAQRCPGSLNADDVEARIWWAVEQVLQDPMVIAREVQRQHERSDELIAVARRELTLIDVALGKCQREEERWTKAYAAEVIELAELKAYRAEIQQRRQALHAQRAQCEAEVARFRSNIVRVDQLIDYRARVRSRLQTFSCAEKRLALQALDIQATWSAEMPLTIQGSIPIEGEIMYSTAKGVMRPPFSAGSNQAGASVTCMAYTSSPAGWRWASIP
jgi:hypothetical protein